MTDVVAVSSMKGGTGKTTVAINLAERAHAAGLRCALIDYDPMEGSIGIADLRDRPGWVTIPGKLSSAGAEELKGLRSSGDYDILVCDLPGKESFTMGIILVEADVTLSPLNISPQELQSAREFRWIGENMGWSLYFLPSNLTSVKKRQLELVTEVSSWGAPVSPVVIQNRVAYVDCFRYGLGVCESSPRSLAAREVQSLWEWLSSILPGVSDLGSGPGSEV